MTHIAILVLVAFTSTAAGDRQGSFPASEDASSLLSKAKTRLAQVSGTLAVPGLKEAVRVVRDRWGVPHIYAKNVDDLFLAQGFVQAQDRLFQMDLWRRGTQGHLAEILGPDYLENDRMSRLIRYRGDMEAEWSSYAPDGRQIISQFVKGINAWVAVAKENPPIEFTMAGIEPGTWEPEDPLSRTEAFLMSGNAKHEAFLARFTAVVGPERAAKLLPPDPVVPIIVPRGLDLQLIDRTLNEALARIGLGFGRNLQLHTTMTTATGDADAHGEGSNNWVVGGPKSVTGHPLLANDPHRALDHPSLRYIVHLNAPGWNVIGVNQPWLPGVSFGHNDRVAWGVTSFQADVQDLYVEKLNPDGPKQYESRGKWVDMTIVKDRLRVKGRPEPVEVELQYTVHGPVVAVDQQKHVAFALRWTGAEPGTAGYLAGIGLDRARNAAEFRENLKRWKMPGENVVYADVEGNIGYQASALTPVRKNWPGLMPVPGASGEYEWSGWHGIDELPHGLNPAAGFFATANHNTLPPGEKRVINYLWEDPARINRIREVLTSKPKFSIEDFEKLQHDSVARKAEQLVPLLRNVTATDNETERARQLLLTWDRRVAGDSGAAAIYVVWEQKLTDELVAGKVQGPIASEYSERPFIRQLVNQLVVPGFTSPDPDWFGASPTAARDKALLAALAAAVTDLKGRLGPDMSQWQWGRIHSATFRHLLASDPQAQRLLDVGPFPRGGYVYAPFSTGGRGFEQERGASYRQIMDLADWDRSVATSAPGQSGQPGSPHFDDLAKLWAEHQYFPLAFSHEAVQANAEAIMMLTPAR